MFAGKASVIHVAKSRLWARANCCDQGVERTLMHKRTVSLSMHSCTYITRACVGMCNMVARSSSAGTDALSVYERGAFADGDGAYELPIRQWEEANKNY